MSISSSISITTSTITITIYNITTTTTTTTTIRNQRSWAEGLAAQRRAGRRDGADSNPIW